MRKIVHFFLYPFHCRISIVSFQLLCQTKVRSPENLLREIPSTYHIIRAHELSLFKFHRLNRNYFGCLTCLFWYQTRYSTEFSFTFPSFFFSYYFYRCCCYFFEEVTELFRCNWFFLKKTMSAIKLHAVISWVHIELA